MPAPHIPTDLKTYRASRTIAGEHKNCGFCRERISVGMPVQFVPGRGCWHAGCVEALLKRIALDNETAEPPTDAFLVQIDTMIESVEEFIADEQMTPENDPDLAALNHVRALYAMGFQQSPEGS